MKLSRGTLVPMLTIVAGGLIGASLSFGLLGSRSDDEVRVVERSYFSGRTKGGDQYFYVISSDGESFRGLTVPERQWTIAENAWAVAETHWAIAENVTVLPNP